MFCYPLGPVPWSLATSAGELMKTNKATLMHELENGSTSVDAIQRPFATIIDGMALVRKVKHAGHTFDSFTDELLESAVSSSIGASRIDIVFDVYRDHSIKNAERGHRETGTLQFRWIIGNQTIKQYAAFLSSSNNKLELIKFLVSRWKTNCSYIGNTEVNVAFDESCIQLGNGNNTNVEQLSCNHEEADTRLLFHAKKISESFRRIIIYTPDKDVFLIALGVSSQISGNLFITTGTQNKARIICLSKVKEALQIKYDLQDMDFVSKALLGLHGFTGCDTISAFSGKGKVKPLQLMLKNIAYFDLFASIGGEPELLEDLFRVVQKFICVLYGHKEDNTNNVCYKLYAAKQGRLDPKSIPPCSDSLRMHAARATYQVYIWRNCLESHPDIPSPVGFGWDQNDSGDFIIKWNTVNPAPDEVLDVLLLSQEMYRWFLPVHR